MYQKNFNREKTKKLPNKWKFFFVCDEIISHKIHFFVIYIFDKNNFIV